MKIDSLKITSCN